MFKYDDLLKHMLNISSTFGVILVTSFYESSNQKRNEEIRTCLMNNVKNKFIKEIYLLNDKIYDLHFLTDSSKIKQIVVDDNNKSRLGFDYAINFTNKFLKGKVCMIANSDIYYDETLCLLNKYDFNKKVFALSRYEDNTKKLKENACGSQDTWIYKSPVKIDIEQCNFKFGLLACDHRIAYLFSKYNNVINPCLTLKSYHLHSSNYRTYTQQTTVLGDWLFVNESYLDLEYCFLDSINQFIDNNGLFFCTFINEGYFPFVHNYILNLKKLNLNYKFLVVCVDEESYSLCKKYDINSVLYDITYNNQYSSFGSDVYKNIVMCKVDVISLLLKNKNIKTLIYTDTDIAVYKDFMPYLKSLDMNNVDIYFQSDNNKSIINLFDSNRCTGFMLIKNNQNTRELFTHVPLKNIPHFDGDQDYINYKITQMTNIVCNQLPRDLFPNGVFFNDKNIPENAYLLHYNYMKGSDKQKNMMSNGDWLTTYSIPETTNSARFYSNILPNILKPRLSLKIKDSSSSLINITPTKRPAVQISRHRIR